MMRAILKLFVWIGLAVTSVALPGLAHAQSFTYVNTADGTINATRTCAAPLVRNFNVSDSFVVADVNLGFFATHTWRGDIRITLRAPNGTQVQLVDGDDAAISGDNLNVLLDDSFTQTVNTDSATGNHSTVNPPPFQNNFAPNNSLSAFNGVGSAGTWRMEICDLFPDADDGNFRHAELYLTAQSSNFADLSLTKTVSNSAPTAGSTISYTLQVSSSSLSTNTATGIQVTDVLPAGTTYVGQSGSGSYNAATGIWQVGSLAPGASASLTITVNVNATAGAIITNTAEITASSQADPDSTPGNGLSTEDDFSSASFSVSGSRIAGTPPTLLCTAGTAIFDWDSVSWTAGSTNNSYPLGGLGNINFNLANPGTWLNNAAVGGQSPSRQNVVTGGLPTAQFSLLELVDLPNQSAVVTTTINLPTAMLGAQFTLFDIDFASGQFADRIVVTGYYNGAVVMPTLTNGVVNYVIGNSAYGDGDSGNTSANGNLVVTFDGPIDQIVLEYGNHSLAPANPGQQGITIHDMTFCLPTTSLSATKVSSIFSDPVNGSTDPKAIPGAMVEYLISVSNTGELPADSGTVAVTDIVPPETKMCLADVSGGSGPILFQDNSGTTGLSYSYSGLSSTTDNLSFSSDGGSSFTYTPTADADGCDAAITHFRVAPTGEFAEGTSFNLRARFMVE